MRNKQKLIEIERELELKVWYDRHQLLKARVENRDELLVEKYAGPGTISREIWEGALESAKRVEEEFGLENIGPYEDFEWGMLNGKLSAVRWMLGEEWDTLDT